MSRPTLFFYARVAFLIFASSILINVTLRLRGRVLGWPGSSSLKVSLKQEDPKMKTRTSNQSISRISFLETLETRQRLGLEHHLREL